MHRMCDGRPCCLADSHRGRHRASRAKIRLAHRKYNNSAKGILRNIRYDAGRRFEDPNSRVAVKEAVDVNEYRGAYQRADR